MLLEQSAVGTVGLLVLIKCFEYACTKKESLYFNIALFNIKLGRCRSSSGRQFLGIVLIVRFLGFS
jgi:hypothetical protein